MTGPSVLETSLLPDPTVAAPAAGEGEVPEPAAGDSVERPRASESDAESPERASGGVDAPDDPAAVTDAAKLWRGWRRCAEIAAPSDVESPLGPMPTRLATSEAATPSPEDRGGTNGQSFSDPGGDVAYPPNASFAMDDDVSYPLPIGSGLDACSTISSTVQGVVRLSISRRSLAICPSRLALRPRRLDLRLMRARGEGRRGADERCFARAGRRSLRRRRIPTAQNRTGTTPGTSGCRWATILDI